MHSVFRKKSLVVLSLFQWAYKYWSKRELNHWTSLRWKVGWITVCWVITWLTA